MGHLGASPALALGGSALLQSAAFALYHANSPGATRASLINLFVGGAPLELFIDLSYL